MKKTKDKKKNMENDKKKNGTWRSSFRGNIIGSQPQPKHELCEEVRENEYY